jgi:hypothetical protein
MNLKEIESLMKAGGHITVEIHAVDLSIYQIFQRFSGRLIPVTSKGKNALFRSRFSALKALADLGLDEVDFVHRSAYGEMIGMESPFDQTELRQRVRVAHLRD